MAPLRRSIRSAAVILSTIVVCAAGLEGCAWRTKPLELPSATAQTSRIVAADGSVVISLHAEQDREVVSLAAIARPLTDAVVAIEDERFWSHPGVDVRSLVRAAAANAESGSVEQGGSTITEQYVKNVLLDTSRTLHRKVTEAALAVQVEHHYTKQRILELYLNTIYFGNGAYGVQAASHLYFARDASQLDLAQAAFLAGVIHSPAPTDPYRHPVEALDRRNVVLRKMASLGLVDGVTAARAKATPLAITPLRPERYPAPFFVERVKRFLLDDPRFGATPDARRDLLFKGGLRISTTLDPRLQAAAEAARDQILPGNAVSQPSAAVVSIEPRTGFVRAVVGGRDFFGDGVSARFDLATQGSRPAGSSFKPLVLAAALQAGVPLTTTYPAPAHLDIALPPGSGPDPVWKVNNYDADESAPSMDLVEATVHSVNTVYAQLILQVGPQQAVDLASRMGISSHLAPYPSAVLGTNDVTPLDMADAYATFATGGIHVAPTYVIRVTTADGTVLYDHEHQEDRVLDPAVADAATAVMGQVVARGTGRAAAVVGHPVAGKTGTGQEWRDAWFVGFTPQLATAVWVGFADRQRSMVPPATPFRITGGSWPAQIWQRFMAAALVPLPAAPLPTFPPASPTPTPTPTTGPSTTGVTTSTIPVYVAPTTTTVAPPEVVVPSVLGMRGDEASARLAALGLVVVREDRADFVVAAGLVNAQSPGGGTSVPSGSTVTITVSTGPPTR